MNNTSRNKRIESLSLGGKRRGYRCFSPLLMGIRNTLGARGHSITQDKPMTDESERKGGGFEMKNRMKKKHNNHFGRLCRRTVALSLALSMVLPLFASAFDSLEMPTEVTDSKEFPTITVEANAVVDRWYDPDGPESAADYLTGYLEVAIRVKSGEKDGKLQDFNTVSLALKYSPLLTPYDWTVQKGWVNKDADGNEIVQPVDLTGTSGFGEMTSIQTLKNNRITTAVGHVSTSENENVGGYLYIMANADRPVTLAKDTVLAVVRFKYNLEDDETAGITGIRPVAADVDTWVNPVNTATCLIQLATPDELGEDYIQPEVYYDSADNGMYYTTALADPDDRRREAKKADGSGDTDKNSNLIPLSVDYTTIEPNQINFTLVNKTTYNDGGLSLDDLATVLFYDWDNTLIGVLIVPRDGDARKLVNDYVSKTFIHPDLRADKTTGANTNYASLARADSYRGKYPSSEPKAEGVTDGTEDPNGSAYPLTNKLDYVFVKRPMERVTEDETGNPVTENLWRQKEAEDGLGAWDDNYPYIHGWAKLPDKDWNNPNAVWTTIGVGELSSYSGLINGAYVSSESITTAPVELTATVDNFTFADFDFRKSNNNSLKAGGVYSVKAVYEPGPDLQTTAVQYQMISEPYYNKLNYNAAANGGAYSVDITVGRVNDVSGSVRGVARIREPAVRQDTTADIRWNDQDLKNTSVIDEKGKDMTTYSKVVVDNGEEIQIQLVLSARHNKVDYYLINTFGLNFVGGGLRTVANTAFEGTAHVIDNYNYKTDSSGEQEDGVSADYYDAPYEDRDGSYGFVLYGTLNNLAQKLTEDYRGTLSAMDFNNYITTNNLNNINLRDENGDKPTARTLTNFKNALRAAAAQAAKRHDPDDSDYPGRDDRAWDAEHGYAQFGYHQLQYFVRDYLANGSAELMTNEDADKIPFNKCHLHEECAAQASGKPRNWGELIAVAQSETLDMEQKVEKITLLTLAELEDMTHLRADGTGNAYTNNRVLAIAFVRAVEAGNTTWDTIQDYIVRGTVTGTETDPEEYSQENYWWYDGQAPSFGDLANTAQAALDAIFPKAVPGETSATAVVRNAKLNQLQSVFEANLASDAVTTAWNNATKNLSITRDGVEGQKFTSWTDFRSRFTAAVEEAENAGVRLVYAEDDNADARAKKLREYWNQIQYSILHPDKPFPVAHDSEMDDYWWYDGAVKVTNLATLIKAAQNANSGKTASMDMFLFDALYDEDNKELHFARNFKGEKYTDDEDLDLDVNENLVFTEFKEKIRSYVRDDRSFLTNQERAGQPYSWDRVQYYLNHGTMEGVDIYLRYESVYYWWKEGKPVEPVSFDLGPDDPADPDDPTAPDIRAARADALAVALMDAAFRATYNGNTRAWEELTEEIAVSGRIVAGSTGNETSFPDEFTTYGTSAPTLEDLKKTVVALMLEMSGTTESELAGIAVPAFPVKTASWHQIQYYILANRYEEESSWIESSANYWWKGKNANGASGPTLFGEISAFVERIAGGDTSAADELRDWIDDEKIETLEFVDSSGEPISTDAWKEIPWEDFEYSVCGDPFDAVTWAQIALLIPAYELAGEWYFVSDEDAVGMLEGDLGMPSTPSWWVTTFSVRRRAAAPARLNLSSTIDTLSVRLALLRGVLKKEPARAEEYRAELEALVEELRQATAELDALLNALEQEDQGLNTESPVLTETAEPDTVESNVAESNAVGSDTVEPDTVEPDDPGRLNDVTSVVEPDDPGRLTDSSVKPDTVEPDDLGEPTNTDPVKVDTVEPDDLGGLSDTASSEVSVEPDDPGEPTNTAGMGVSMASAAENIIEETAVRNVWSGYLVMPSAGGGENRLSAPLTTKLVKRLTPVEKQRLITIENRTVYNNSRLISRAGPPLRSPTLSRISIDFIVLTSERRMAA